MIVFSIRKIMFDDIVLTISSESGKKEVDGLKFHEIQSRVETRVYNELWNKFLNHPESMKSLSDSDLFVIANKAIDEEEKMDPRVEEFDLTSYVDLKWNYESEEEFEDVIEKTDIHSLLDSSYVVDSEDEKQMTIGDFKKLNKELNERNIGKDKPARVTFGLGREGS